MKLKQNAIFFTILSLIFLTCTALWLWADYPVTHISSDDGTRDLRGADFSTGSFDLYGPAEYIPNALLSPREFAARPDEIEIGPPESEASYSTSRVRIAVPDGIYGIMMWNADYATNIFINGELMESVGVPGIDAAHTTPKVTLLYFTAEAKDGIVEIVQQASSLGITGNGSNTDIVIGCPGAVREIYNKQIALPLIMMGCFLALALAHLALFSQLHRYKANLLFAIFCFVWFVRVGVTSPWILNSTLPLSGYVFIRLKYLTGPAAMLLLSLTFHALFPGILQKWFRVALSAICGIFSCVSLLVSVAVLSSVYTAFYIAMFLSIAYIILRLFMKLRKPNPEQLAVIAGASIFFAGATSDVLRFLIFFSPATSTMNQLEISAICFLAFMLFVMAAMFRGTMREITAAKEAEQLSRMEAETQRRLSTMKSEFMGELSHELRMPISTISGFAQYFQELLGDETLNLDDLRTGALRVEGEAERMDRLVSQLLDMAAIEAGSFTIRKERVSVEDLFDKIRHIYFPMFNRARNRLTVKFDGDIIISADRERVLQVLLNLVSNACKYTEDGEITIAAEKQNGMAQLCVADTGEGMGPETMPLLFTRYPQMRGGVKGVTGNGLGLFISKKLAEAHGGGIGVESEPGKGTKVWFTIPLKGDDEE